MREAGVPPTAGVHEGWASPFFVGPEEGRAPHLEALRGALAASRHFLLSAVRGLEAAALQTRPAYHGNSVGDLLVHIAAAERLFQRVTRDGSRFGEEDAAFARAFRFEEDPLVGQGIEAYERHLAGVRAETDALFAARDDAWLVEARTFASRPSTTHYYWLHLLMDEQRHTGEVILLRKYLLPGADGSFDAYGGL